MLDCRLPAVPLEKDSPFRILSARNSVTPLKMKTRFNQQIEEVFADNHAA